MSGEQNAVQPSLLYEKLYIHEWKKRYDEPEINNCYMAVTLELLAKKGE